MTGRLVQHHEARFSARNHPTDALVGLLRATDWLEAFVARHATETDPTLFLTAPTEGSSDASTAEARDDVREARAREELTLFLLGLVATGRAARRVIERWAAGATAPVAPSPATSPSDRRGWLR